MVFSTPFPRVLVLSLVIEIAAVQRQHYFVHENDQFNANLAWPSRTRHSQRIYCGVSVLVYCCYIGVIRKSYTMSWVEVLLLGYYIYCLIRSIVIWNGYKHISYSRVAYSLPKTLIFLCVFFFSFINNYVISTDIVRSCSGKNLLLMRANVWRSEE